MRSQRARLLACLRRKAMTTGEIQNQLGIGRPAARVLELKEAGFNIESEKVPVKNRLGQLVHVAKYKLAKKINRQKMRRAA